MGYFSNGTEGDMWQQDNCTRCVHTGDCAVWDAHQAFNYDQCSNKGVAAVLGVLIPRTADGFCGKCKMFSARAQTDAEHDAKVGQHQLAI